MWQRLPTSPRTVPKTRKEKKMEKVFKPGYVEPRLEIMAFINSDIITTSGVGDVGSDNNIDDGGWTNSTTW